MQDLARQRCFNHRTREAVARCPECGRFFCRECITEHKDRILCASCLEKQHTFRPVRTDRFGWIVRTGQFLSGTIFLWLFFYYLGRILLSLPSSFHEGTLWNW